MKFSALLLAVVSADYGREANKKMIVPTIGDWNKATRVL